MKNGHETLLVCWKHSFNQKNCEPRPIIPADTGKTKNVHYGVGQRGFWSFIWRWKFWLSFIFKHFKVLSRAGKNSLRKLFFEHLYWIRRQLSNGIPLSNTFSPVLHSNIFTCTLLVDRFALNRSLPFHIMRHWLDIITTIVFMTFRMSS